MSLDARPNRMPVRASDNPGSETNAAVDHGSIAEALRARREQLGWALPDIAQWLRIRLPYLEALEEGRFSELPGTAYAVGFLKTYAQALGYEPEDMARRFGQETAGQMARKPELTFPSPKPERGVPLSVWMAVGLVLVIVTYAVWFRMNAHQVTPSEHVPPVAEIMPGVTSHGTASPQVASVLPGPGHAPSAIPVVAPVVKPVTDASQHKPETLVPPAVQTPHSQLPVGQTPPVKAAPSPVSTPAVQAEPLTSVPATEAEGNAVSGRPAQAQAAPVTPPVQDPAQPLVADVSSGTIVFHATADSWLAVRDGQNHLLIQRVLKAGETWGVPESADADMVYRATIGNAGGISVSAGGVTSAALGRNGAVLHGISISTQAVRDGKFGKATPSPAQ